ncbi:hypothetical protein PG995_009145 [Apiospora arundinis]
MVPQAAEWYTQASYGALNLNIAADTTAYYRMPKAAAAYNWMGNGYRQDTYAQDALDAFTANGARPPPSGFDVLYVVPTGRAASYISRSQTADGAIPTRQGQKVAKKLVTFGAADWDLSWLKSQIHLKVKERWKQLWGLEEENEDHGRRAHGLGKQYRLLTRKPPKFTLKPFDYSGFKLVKQIKILKMRMNSSKGKNEPIRCAS